VPADGELLFVLAGAAPGGSGTQESPFGTIREAMETAASGTTVVLSKGTFDEAVRPGSGVSVVGACVAETRIDVSSLNA